MALSARNQLKGRIIDLKLDSIMANVVVQVGENLTSFNWLAGSGGQLRAEPCAWRSARQAPRF